MPDSTRSQHWCMVTMLQSLEQIILVDFEDNKPTFVGLEFYKSNAHYASNSLEHRCRDCKEKNTRHPLEARIPLWLANAPTTKQTPMKEIHNWHQRGRFKCGKNIGMWKTFKIKHYRTKKKSKPRTNLNRT